MTNKSLFTENSALAQYLAPDVHIQKKVGKRYISTHL